MKRAWRVQRALTRDELGPDPRQRAIYDALMRAKDPHEVLDIAERARRELKASQQGTCAKLRLLYGRRHWR